MELKELKPGHHKELITLWEASDLEHKPLGRDAYDHIAEEIRQNPRMFLGAFEDGELIGSIIGTYDGRRGWLNRLAVRPDQRGKGIGALLIAEMEERLRERGAKLIAVHVYSSNADSIEVFKRCGYLVFEGVSYLSKRENEDV